jgi:hypothetical protein
MRESRAHMRVHRPPVARLPWGRLWLLLLLLLLLLLSLMLLSTLRLKGEAPKLNTTFRPP